MIEMTISYEIRAQSRLKSELVRNIFFSYGYNYDWRTETQVDLDESTIVICIFAEKSLLKKRKGIPANSKNHHDALEVVFTTSESLLNQYNIERTVCENKFGYLIYLDEKNEGIPIKASYFVGLDFNTKWKPVHAITFGAECILKPVTICKTENKICRFIVGLNLLALLENAMFGSKDADDDNWGDQYGEEQTQSLSSINYIDLLLKVLFGQIQRFIPHYLPLTVDHNPPGISAPLIITGDTDSSTDNDIREFIDCLNIKSQKSSLMFFNFVQYNSDLLKSALAFGHSFGIHPYSANNDAKEYTKSFETLLSNCEIYTEKAFGVRNHLFQRVNSTITLELASKYDIDFDLNCVASSDKTWIGTGSGVGIPIPYPNLDKIVLQCPTIIEDDVFIYDLDYCYKNLQNGVYFSDDLCQYFLENWIVDLRLPCVVNLHPEHIKPQYRALFDRISDWAYANSIWSPSLNEYYNWLSLRSQTRIEVENNHVIVKVVLPITCSFLDGSKVIIDKSSELTQKHLFVTGESYDN